MKVIHLLRKPCSEPTVAENVLRHGTGGINVDGTRVATDETLGRAKGGWGDAIVGASNYGNFNSIGVTKEGGRWPANLILDGSDEVVGLFPQTGKSSGGGGLAHTGYEGGARRPGRGHGDSGSAARFFKQMGGATKTSTDG